jgi:hypothetical protein
MVRPPRARPGLATLAADGAVSFASTLERLTPRRRADRARRSRRRLPVALPSELVVGRRWIALVAFALIGIVTMQLGLGLLRLNGGIGRALEQEAALQRENAALSIENAEMAASDRVQSRALGIGMELVPAGALRFLWASPQIDPARGAAALSAVRSPTTASEQPAGGGAQTNGPSESASGPEPSTTTTAGAPASTAGPASEQGGGTSGAPSSGAPEATSTPSPSTAPGGGGAAEAGPAGGTQPQSAG